jgi:acetyl-CoA acetyltransferase
MTDVRDRTAVVGVGRTVSDRDIEADPMSHVAAALRAACADAGLSREQLDGVMVNLAPEEGSMDKLPEMLGLPNVRWAFQSWAHGRLQPVCIATAVAAVLTGQADQVACVSTSQTIAGHRGGFAAGRRAEKLREGGGPHLESPVYGLISVGGGAALAWRKYLLKYGGDPEGLGEVALAQRAWAQRQPEAYFHGQPLTSEDYRASPMVVEPLRVLDHCLPGNAGFCMIVTSAERARDCRRPPVYISGMQGAASGREHFVFARTGLGVAQQTEAPYAAPEMPVYRMAGIGREEVDVFGALDAFSPVVLMALEEFGFCGEGEALDWIADGRTGPGGSFPVNTCGGGLSDVESFGWGHSVDIVRQLRGDSGAAQVDGARVGQYVSGDRASVLYSTH